MFFVNNEKRIFFMTDLDYIVKIANLLKEIQNTDTEKNHGHGGLCTFLDQYVIIRTESAGVHFGKLKEKHKTEVILSESRRLWYWHAQSGISLSDVAVHGLKKESKICAELPFLWLNAIEIIPCSEKAIKSIKEQLVYVA